MAKVNDHFLKLQAGYLFPEIGRRVAAFTEAHPDADVIRLGIGDVTEPLPAAIIEAMHGAVDEMANRDTFRGYGPEQGYPFLREAVAREAFAARGVDVSADEIFICGSAEEVTPVVSVDRIPAGDGRPGQITQQLQKLYFEAARGRNPDYTDFLTPVY